MLVLILSLSVPWKSYTSGWHDWHSAVDYRVRESLIDGTTAAASGALCPLPLETWPGAISLRVVGEEDIALLTGFIDLITF
jgi:hypothetical protein